MLTRETMEELRVSRIASGRCPKCGRPKLRHSIFCERHRLTRDRNAYSRARYREAKARHICPTCGEPSGGGYVRCEFCREKARISAERRKHGT